MVAGPLGGLGAAAPVHVGLDVGASKVHGVALRDGVVVAESRLPVRRGVDGLLDSAVTAVQALREQVAGLDGGLDGGAVDGGAVDGEGVGAAWCAGVGVGVPGIVDPVAGTVAHAVNLGVVEAFPLAPRLAARLGVPVVCENDLNVAAVGSAHLMGLDGDLAYLALGTGVAAGLLLDGRLRRGWGGAAGEVGHVPHRPTGPRCACGQRGCLELYASGSALDAAWPSRTGAPSPAEVFLAAAQGDPVAVGLRDDFAEAVATAVQLLLLTVDVRHVVLGGGVAAVGEPLRDEVAAVLERRVAGSGFLATFTPDRRLLLAPAGGRAAPVGAARLAAGTGVSSGPQRVLTP